VPKQEFFIMATQHQNGNKITAKQLTDLIKHSLQNTPLTAELFDSAVLVSQLASGVAV
jgi:hypothetical protein